MYLSSRSIITLTSFIVMVTNGTISMAGEREDAATFIRTTLSCPVNVETSTSSNGWFQARKTHNEYRGNSSTFSLRENFTLTEGQIGAEAYETKNFTDVSFKFSSIASSQIEGNKLTIRCASSAGCMKVRYVSNPDQELEKTALAKDPLSCFHEGMCRTESLKMKSSYRISLCSAEAAKDLKDALNFLSN